MLLQQHPRMLLQQLPHMLPLLLQLTQLQHMIQLPIFTDLVLLLLQPTLHPISMDHRVDHPVILLAVMESHSVPLVPLARILELAFSVYVVLVTLVLAV